LADSEAIMVTEECRNEFCFLKATSCEHTNTHWTWKTADLCIKSASVLKRMVEKWLKAFSESAKWHLKTNYCK